MNDIPCVIFAGGKSSRMGEDKALLPFGDYTTLSEYQYSRLSKLFHNVYISCKNEALFPFTAKFILDDTRNDLYAPTAGFIAAFNSVKSDRFFAISVDTPFVSEKEIRQLLDEDSNSLDATVAKTSKGIHPMCGIYHSSLYNSFVTMQKSNNHKLGALLKKSNVNYVTCEDENAFVNLNHPHEYQEALKQIS